MKPRSHLDTESTRRPQGPLDPADGRRRRVTLVLAVATLLVLLVSVPTSLREAWERGGFYVFSREFIEGIPQRLTGPGQFRFVLQPLIAIILGAVGGVADARAGRPAYIWAVLFRRDLRRQLLTSGFMTVVNLLLMGILLDSAFQWLLFGTSYPGAALVVGPVLITVPYAVARALANRILGLCGKHSPEKQKPPP